MTYQQRKPFRDHTKEELQATCVTTEHSGFLGLFELSVEDLEVLKDHINSLIKEKKTKK